MAWLALLALLALAAALRVSPMHLTTQKHLVCVACERVGQAAACEPQSATVVQM